MKSMIRRLCGWLCFWTRSYPKNHPYNSETKDWSHPSVRQNYLICLETGVHKPVMRRHISQTLGLTPDQYRRKWNLPPSYPMVSQSYIKRRDAAQTKIYGK